MTKIYKEDGSSVEFTCDECGCNELDEILTNATLNVRVLSIGPGGDRSYEVDDPYITDALTSHYICRGCDKEFDSNSHSSFYDFLIENKEIYLKNKPLEKNIVKNE